MESTHVLILSVEPPLISRLWSSFFREMVMYPLVIFSYLSKNLINLKKQKQSSNNLNRKKKKKKLRI